MGRNPKRASGGKALQAIRGNSQPNRAKVRDWGTVLADHKNLGCVKFVSHLIAPSCWYWRLYDSVFSSPSLFSPSHTHCPAEEPRQLGKCTAGFEAIFQSDLPLLPECKKDCSWQCHKQCKTHHIPKRALPVLCSILCTYDT